MSIIITVIITAAACAGVFYLAQYFKKKGIDGTSILEDALKGLGYADSLATAMSPFLKSLPMATIKMVLDAAQKAVTSVEAAYKSQLAANTGAPDTRKVTATNLIKSVLSLEGVNIDGNVSKLISAAIEVLVLALPKTHAVAVTK